MTRGPVRVLTDRELAAVIALHDVFCGDRSCDPMVYGHVYIVQARAVIAALDRLNKPASLT